MVDIGLCGPSVPVEGNELFFRICRLLIDGGTEVMRLQFDKKIPPSELPKKLQKIKNVWKLQNVITAPMRETLFPDDNTYGKSADFDISLLMVLLRNIGGLQPPQSTNSWKDEPSDNDHSLEADIVRLKLYRNKIFAHVRSCSIIKSDFENFAKKIGESLIRLGGKEWKHKVEEILNEPLSQDESIYKDGLEKWYKNDTEMKDIIMDIKGEVGDIKQEVWKISQSRTGMRFFLHIFYSA